MDIAAAIILVALGVALGLGVYIWSRRASHEHDHPDITIDERHEPRTRRLVHSTADRPPFNYWGHPYQR
ncbi:hypothetical protein [Phytomonospora endophytica]|uniref:Uncharacterized protein n=1 Tax=Phytomonospora endophytica TaxID=714109 RepID=A0A841FED2_9ACTN|nr:hypothetical protein [Phytomonospora endophytica]MBB6034194.1 hypothetical protein [Phytomonospora endophytica]GIG66586.1 hypothetical protein Pen01_28810 [Phytomonospora endophytica]